ncbi:hypothetical protein EKO26_09460 [Citrobacter portucalensis]|nr:hypothetical protein EKO26_09460 [Citrobacter portucalensis]
MQHFIRLFVPLFYADKRAFFCLSIVKSRILSFLNRLKNRDFSLICLKNCAKPLMRLVKIVQFKKSTDCFLTT